MNKIIHSILFSSRKIFSNRIHSYVAINLYQQQTFGMLSIIRYLGEDRMCRKNIDKKNKHVKVHICVPDNMFYNLSFKQIL